MSFGNVWLPMVVSAVVVFFASAVLHMVLTYHKADYRRLPGEDGAVEAMRKAGIAPGLYMTPFCENQKQMKEPAVVEKFTKGPVALVAVMPSGPPAMGKSLGLWFVVCLLVSFIAGYLARHTLTPSTDGMTVMRVTGTVAFAAFGIGPITNSIWAAVPWSNTVRALIDAVIYAVLTGLVFRLLWPS